MMWFYVSDGNEYGPFTDEEKAEIEATTVFVGFTWEAAE